METIYLCIVIFLFVLAIFDLVVGVSNDAVNFLQSSVGAKAASFKTVLFIAGIGVFIGAALSNGMMDIARHGIYQPQHFYFAEVMCILLAVMLTDVVLLDVFNTMGMPTSTTVSMVFELLGGTFALSLIKVNGSDTLGLGDLINTDKALSVIMGIFLSVAIAFFFGMLVQWLARVVFTFNYKKNMKYSIAIFGGIAVTSIIYFMLIKGLKDSSFMTAENKQWIHDNTAVLIGGCFLFFSVLMQILHWMKVNVFKVVVLLGTFALALAFAGNDLVNFIGVPLSGLASYQDYIANGNGDATGYLMGSLNGPANTPIYFLIGAGLIMVVSLATSKKARNVAKTEIGLGSQQGGDEMFGSSRIARRLVRWSLSFIAWVRRITPPRVREWFNRRFNVDETIMERGAAFDLIRGSVNLVLAGALIALGTSLKLPLSTTFVTFMVAMGTSLADRAWGRESAVFRITGVISVIGGWFLTAGVAFIGAGLIVAAMHFGGHWVMLLMAVLTIFIIIRSNRRFNRKSDADNSDALFQAIISNQDKEQSWPMLMMYITEQQQKFMNYAEQKYREITSAFLNENAGVLDKAESSLQKQKNILKNARRKETLCLRNLTREMAIEKSTWFYLSNNCCMGMLYNLRRIDEVCKEHVDNNFLPLPASYTAEYEHITAEVGRLFADTSALMQTTDMAAVSALRRHCDDIKDAISDTYHKAHDHLREGDASTMSVLYVYVNVLQETQELVSSIRKYLRAFAKLRDPEFRSRPPKSADALPPADAQTV